MMNNVPNTSHTIVYAYNFFTPYKLDQLQEELSNKMNCIWKSRNKEDFGDYISTNNKLTGTIIRIFQNDNGSYTFDIINRGSCSKEKLEEEMKNLIDILKKSTEASQFTLTENFY